MWKIVRHYGVPEKIVEVLQNIYSSTRCQVIHNNSLSTSFEVITGVRQGCLLSPLLFSLVIDWVMRNSTRQPRGIQWTMMNRLEDLDFADDICLLSHSLTHMQSKTDVLQGTAAATGLHINAQKTKFMGINAQHQRSITLEGQAIEEVEKFTYLGSVVGKKGGSDEDIEARIKKARQSFIMLRPIWKDRHLTQKTKLRIFNSNVKTVLLYGSESWKRTKALDNKLQVFINKCLREILKIWWPETISNEELWQRTNQEAITVTIGRRKWRWVGHTWRREEGNIARTALEWNPQGQRRRGRPCNTWRRTLDAELKRGKLTWAEAKRKAQDRSEWRDIVEALCAT
jgi:hypothetical protein